MRGHLTLPVWHVAAPGTVSLLDCGGDREGDLLGKVGLSWHRLSHSLSNLEGTDRPGLFIVEEAVVNCAHIHRVAQSNLDLLHGLLAVSVVRLNCHRALLSHGVALLGN